MPKAVGPLAVIMTCVVMIVVMLAHNPYRESESLHFYPAFSEGVYTERVAPLPSKPKGVKRDSDRATFMHMQENNPTQPVAWNACSPIHYVINPENAAAGGVTLIQQALDQASRTTGYLFIYDGLTDERHTPGEDRRYQPDRYGERWAPVLIEWEPSIGPEEKPAVGVAAPSLVTFKDGTQQYVTGVIRMSRDEITRYQTSAANALSRQERKRYQRVQRNAVIHEMLHVLGMGHSNTMTDLMFPGLVTVTEGLSAHDIIGLRTLGKQPCRTDAGE